MARSMSKVVPVKVVQDEIHCYATIQRSLMTAITACLRLEDEDMASRLNDIRQWANERFDESVYKKVNECGNPSLG